MGFIVAQCPECGHEVETDEISQPLRLYILMAVLMVHAATIDQIMQLPEYDKAKPGWDEKLKYVSENVDREADEIQQFGDAFDGS